MDYKKVFEHWQHLEMAGFDVFCKWVDSRGIVKFLRHCNEWQRLTRKGLRRTRRYDTYDDCYTGTHLVDHGTLWKDAQGRKVWVLQPYWHYPGDAGSCFAAPNIHYVEGESERHSQEELDRFTNWCEARNLEVSYYPSGQSWYYPGSTMLIEAREKVVDANIDYKKISPK